MTKRDYERRVLAYVKTGNCEAYWYWANRFWVAAMRRLYARGRVRYSTASRTYVVA